MFVARFYSNYLKNCSLAYKNIAKLSAKVYYFQEISKQVAERASHECNQGPGSYYGFNRNLYPVDQYTFNQDDLKQLAVDINKNVHDLSPTQLLSAAISYSNISVPGNRYVGRREWKRLCYAVIRHICGNGYNINAMSPSQVSMVLYSYARRHTEQTPVSYRLLKSCIRSTGMLNERDLSMLLFYMRRTKCVPKALNTPEHLKNAQILRSIALALSKEGGNKLDRCTPNGVVAIVYNFTQIGMIPWSLIYHACNLVKKKAAKIDNKSVGFHARALSQLNIRDKKALESFVSKLSDSLGSRGEGAVSRRKEIPLATMSALVYALAKLKYRPKSDLTPILSEIKRSMVLFEDRDVALIAYSLGQLGIKSTEFFEALVFFLKARIDHQSPQHLSMFVRAYSKLGIYDEAAIELIVSQSLKLLTGFSIQQIVCLLDSLVVLGFFEPSAFNQFLNYLCTFSSDEMDEYLINQLNRISYSIQLEHPEYCENSPDYANTLFDQYQGNFMIRESVESDSLYRTLKELGIDYRTNERVGAYVPDVCLPGNVTVEMLSKGSVCPLTNEVLGSAMMQKRHLEQLGYKHVQIIKTDWVKKSDAQRRRMLAALTDQPNRELV